VADRGRPTTRPLLERYARRRACTCADTPTPFREMTPDDLDDMAALLGDPKVMRSYPHPKSRDEALAWITWNQRWERDSPLTCGKGWWARQVSNL
jgi:RimJ/RimL family protein N-acetyltransferase